MLRNVRLAAALLVLVACATDRPDPPVRTVRTASEIAALTPGQTLERLKAGNLRFVSRTPTAQDWKAQLEASAEGVHPSTAVLTTPDPRIPIPLVFDLGIGDVASLRTPGPTLAPDVVRGLEFLVAGGEVKVAVVLTHSDCPSVEAACAASGDPLLADVVAEIRAAVDATPRESSDRIIQGMEYADAVAAEHAVRLVERLRAVSPSLAAAEDEGRVAIVPAYYDVATGAIVWL